MIIIIKIHTNIFLFVNYQLYIISTKFLFTRFTYPQSPRNCSNCTISFHYPYLSIILQIYFPLLIHYILISWWALQKPLYGRSKDLTTYKNILHLRMVHLIKKQPVCETKLRPKMLKSLPSDCQTRIISAQLEIWHPLSLNQWLFIVSQPATATALRRLLYTGRHRIS